VSPPIRGTPFLTIRSFAEKGTEDDTEKERLLRVGGCGKGSHDAISGGGVCGKQKAQALLFPPLLKRYTPVRLGEKARKGGGETRRLENHPYAVKISRRGEWKPYFFGWLTTRTGGLTGKVKGGNPES